MEVVKKPTRKLRKAPVSDETPKKWFEHKLWTDGIDNYELDPNIRKRNIWFWKNLTPDEAQRDRPLDERNSGHCVRATKDGSAPKEIQRRKLRPI